MNDFFMIHATPERMWYVENFLLPSLHEQGIGSILWNDKDHVGNLTAFLDSLAYCIDTMQSDDRVWHLQDDVIIGRRFFQETHKRLFQHKLIYGHDIICGFCNDEYDEYGYEGIVSPEHIWYSFQCICIPVFFYQPFLDWIEDKKVNDFFISKIIERNKQDDTLFGLFLNDKFPDARVLLKIPNLVDHVDDIVGGSLINQLRGKPTRARFFPDGDLVRDLEEKVNGEKIKTCDCPECGRQAEVHLFHRDGKWKPGWGRCKFCGARFIP